MKYEYKIVEKCKGHMAQYHANNDLELMINKFGEDGWELIKIHHQGPIHEEIIIFYFKRQINGETK